MKTIQIILSLVVLCISAAIFAQQRGDGVFKLSDVVFAKDFKKFNDENTQLVSNSDSVRYDNIKGSPFWTDSLQPALLYNSKGYIGTVPARINLAVNSIHFLLDAEEMILNDNIVNRVVFKTGNDSAVFIGQVSNLLLFNKPVTDFLQVLSFGKYQLLKYTKRKIASEESPSHTSRIYYFTDNVYYFIKSDERVEHVKKLNQENLLVHLPSSSAYAAWIKENDISFKNEKDIIKFLNYYNTQLSKK